jgi:homopolymeric O-antigen transport system ATP-binding protein
LTQAQVIVVRDLGKEYALGSGNDAFQYDLLRDAVTAAAASLMGRRGGPRRKPARIWALKDVGFTVPRGEVVGIVGRNGAGKSTLLKILSRITRPTEGAADLFGRVGSLLEVGTGFHPELTGRENIYLNGAILGMRRAEIARAFDAIVDFSGVAAFLDTPVKRYSSGMYVRLAFAVAAHLETEILLVDEVLAVGDAEFQRKCLGKMQSVVREGRTVLFVSHNMAAVKSLCHRAVWIDHGRLAQDGPVDRVVDAYLSSSSPAAKGGEIPLEAARIGTGEAMLRSIDITTADGSVKHDFHLGEPIAVKLELLVREPIDDAVIEVGFSTLDGTRVASLFSVDGGQPPFRLQTGVWACRLDIATTLLPRVYNVDAGVHHARYGATIDWLERVASFSVLNVDRDGGDSHFPSQTRGFFRPDAEWRIEQRTDLPAVTSRER